MEELTLWLELLGNLGVIGLLSLALIAGLKGWVYPASIIDAVIARTVERVLDELEQRGHL